MAGRGSLLDKFRRTKEENEKKAQEEEQGLQEKATEAAQKEQPVAAASAVGRGRGSLLSKFQPSPSLGNESILSASDSASDVVSTSSATNVTASSSQSTAGVGRGKHLMNLLNKTKPVVTVEKVVGHSKLDENLQSMTLSDTLSSGGRTTAQTSSVTEIEPVCRQGSSGQQVQLTGNYIYLRLDEDKAVHQYEVRFEPDIDNRRLRSKLLSQHMEALGGVRTFDGTLLHLPTKLAKQRTVFQSIHPADESEVQVTIIYKRPIPMTENVSFFNVLMNRVLKELELVRIGRHDFNPAGAHNIPQHKLEVWPGYVTAISILEGGLLLNLDATHRVMRQDTVLDLMSDIYKKDRNNMKEKIISEVMGCSVLTRYNNRTYKIDDIDWTKNPKYEFDYKGQPISLVQYYKTHHNVELKDLEQPLLVHRAKQRNTQGATIETICLLIPELCFLAGMTDSIRKDFKVAKDLAQVTKVSPQARREVIRNFIQQVKANPKTCKIFSDWGLTIEPDTVDISGRTLAPEDIYFGKNEVIKGTDKADWKRDVGRKPVLRTPNMMNWAVIFDNRDRKSVEDFISTMDKVCRAVSMKIGEPKKIVLKNDRLESYTNELRNVISPNLNMVVVILKSNRSDYYNAIKKLCCVEKVCPSQVILQRTLGRPDKLKGIVEKIALQINCKLGGALWALKNPFGNMMVVGIDVYHAGPGGSSKGSVAAFVASLDKDLSQWHSKVCMQKPHQELVDLLKSCFISALNVYRQRNNQYPDRIIVYRDGVGDGDMEVVKNYEIKQFVETCEMIDPAYKPKMTVVIVQKRVNTRIFEKKKQLFNPGPGTIVDSIITRRYLYDFYLVPQLVNEGTVTPTHYVVLFDGADLKTDHLQRFTFKLCHLYYNWPGTIRVPAPCQYAHKLAYLVGQSIKTEPDPSLTNYLYYL